MRPRREWIDMTWPDFAGADVSSWIAVLPLAAVEQHGPHLPLGTDALIGEAYLTRARALMPKRLPVTILPAEMVGASREHRAFPGTLSFSPQTLLAMLADLGESLHAAGLRKLVIISAHGGNSEVIALAARELRARLNLLVVTASWARFGYPAGLFEADEVTHGIHGGAIETSIMLAARPDLVRMAEARDFASVTLSLRNEYDVLHGRGAGSFGWMTQDFHASGALGDATRASAEKGEAILAHGAKRFVALLEDVARYDLGRLARGPLDQDRGQTL